MSIIAELDTKSRTIDATVFGLSEHRSNGLNQTRRSVAKLDASGDTTRTPTRSGAGSTSSPPVIAISVNNKYKGKLEPGSPLWDDHTKSFEFEIMDAYGLAETIQQGHAIAAVHHTRRHTDNFISAHHIGLDFDTEDERSTLEALQAHSFIGQYAAILHTTSSHTPEKPRARAIIILDRPIRDAAQYSECITALHRHLRLPLDSQCTDAARLWYGAEGCEMDVRADKVLPVEVLDGFLAQYQAHKQAQQRSLDIDPSIDPNEALDTAIREVNAGARNTTGFLLACKLRDFGMSSTTTLNSTN